MYRFFTILSVLLVLLPVGCSYKFVDPSPATGYTLVSVRNSTPESGLAPLLEDAMRRFGGFKESSAHRLSVAITDFSETVDSVSSSGVPVRQKLTMEVDWKVEGDPSNRVTFGKKRTVRTYPYSADLVTLDWNRSAAVRLLTETAARSILEDLRGQL